MSDNLSRREADMQIQLNLHKMEEDLLRSELQTQFNKVERLERINDELRERLASGSSEINTSSQSDPVNEENQNQEENIQIEWIEGYRTENNTSHPGKLIINGKEKFTCNKVKENILFYHCTEKRRLKCKSKARVEITENNVGSKEFKVTKWESNHNHNTSEGKVLAEKLILEMKEKMQEGLRSNTSIKASDIRKTILQRYKLRYENGTEEEKTVWQEAIHCLPKDTSIDKTLNKIKQQYYGNIPKGRNDFEPNKVLEALREHGGESILVLDSKDLMEHQNEEDPKRILIFTTQRLLKKMGQCKKGSVDGTFRISPESWTQVFLLKLKMGDKFLPIAFGLLPDKEEKSYTKFFSMISKWLENHSIVNNVRTLITDYELAILNANAKTWKCKLEGCQFHYGQCIQRWTDQTMKEALQDSKFEEIFRCLLAFPMLNLQDLDSALRYVFGDHYR